MGNLGFILSKYGGSKNARLIFRFKISEFNLENENRCFIYDFNVYICK